MVNPLGSDVFISLKITCVTFMECHNGQRYASRFKPLKSSADVAGATPLTFYQGSMLYR